jgi:hypothetical protein
MSDAVVTLVFTSGPEAGSRLELVHETTIGREAEIVIGDEEASRRHATLRPVPGGVEVLDLGSLNGTIVDGDRLKDSPRLAGNGSIIKIGATTLSVELPVPDAGATRIAKAVPADGATRVAQTLPDEGDRTVMRARPQFEQPFEATRVGRYQPIIDPALATPASEPAPAAAPPQSAPEPAAAVGSTPAVKPEPEAAPAPAPKAPPPVVRALFGYLFGAGPEKIPARMAIVVGSYTILVVVITVLIYSLVS